MPFNSGFQVGLELTNVVAPLTGAVSRVCNLAVADALKRSGSDIITETKLAALIGRHRIDAAIKAHFKNCVTPFNQIAISRYVDIALHSGAGPTVQEALREGNPAIFSMVVQLSLLSFACHEESLAFGMSSAIESMLQMAGNEPERAPDFVSLLGTIRACRQQTVNFRWHYQYEAIEIKIESHHTAAESQRSRETKRKLFGTDILLYDCIVDRSLPYNILKALMMWIPSLQNFPEERQLHIKTSTGICTIIVWCHYILSINLVVLINGIEIPFGDGKIAVILEAVDGRRDEKTVLYDAKDPAEPLFTLSPSREDPPLESGSRFDALGFGRKVLQPLTKDPESIASIGHWIISKVSTLVEEQSISLRLTSIDPRLPSMDDIVSACQLVFDLEDQSIDLTSLQRIQENDFPPMSKPILERETWESLVDLVFAFSRVANRHECGALPLSLRAFWPHKTDADRFTFKSGIPSMCQSFHRLSQLLTARPPMDPRMDEQGEMSDRTILVSAWGWSVFLGCMDAPDPDRMDINHFMVRQGVPTHKGNYRVRITDGPTRPSWRDSSFAKHNALDLEDGVTFNPGVSNARRGPVLIGSPDASTFSVVQTFEWQPLGHNSSIDGRLGFREMLGLRLNLFLLPAHDCKGHQSADPSNTDQPFILERKRFTMKTVYPASAGDISQSDVLKHIERQEGLVLKITNHLQIEGHFWFFFVKHSEVSRWLQACAFAYLAETYKMELVQILAPRAGCPSCAVEDTLHLLPDEKAVKFVIS